MKESYKPIIRKIARPSIFQAKPVPQPHTTLVFVKGGKPISGDVPFNWGLVRWDCDEIYEIDLSSHNLTWQVKLPSGDKGYEFQPVINIKCQVIDPAMVVKEMIEDVTKFLWIPLAALLRPVAKKYKIQARSEAEEELQQTLQQNAKALTLETGFALKNIMVQLNLDEKAGRYLEELQEIENDIEKEEIIQKKRKKELKNLLKLMKRKLKFFGQEIGLKGLPLYRLIQDPDAAKELSQEKEGQRLLQMKMKAEAINLALEKDALTGPELTDYTRQLLQEFSGMFDEVKPPLVSGTSPRQLASSSAADAPPTGPSVANIENMQ